MKKIFSFVLVIFFYQQVSAQCSVTASASLTTVYCGQPVSLSAFGFSTGTALLNGNFNSGGLDAGWSSAPGSVNFTNPCSPAGADSTLHAWLGNTTSIPRGITSPACNLAAATSGATLCFDMKFAGQGTAAPCEGPDEPDEGVYVQYSTDAGATWTNIHYFDPDGGYDPLLTSWNNWCFALPAAALSSGTIFRWYQLADSGIDYDHWGIDNINVYPNDVNSELTWLHDGYSYGTGNPGGIDPVPVSPVITTTYTAQLITGSHDTCSQSVTVTVLPAVFDVTMTAAPNPISAGSCAIITATAAEIISPAGTRVYENNESSVLSNGNYSATINVQGLHMASLTAGAITRVVINSFNFSGTSVCNNMAGCPCGTGTIAFGQSCTINSGSFTLRLTSPGGCSIILVPAGIATGSYSGTVFVPSGGAMLGGSFPGGGPWAPHEPFSNLNGCDPNGVWTLSFEIAGTPFGTGFANGWGISFEDPAVTEPVAFTWSPATDMTGSGTLTPTVCPPDTATYSLTVANPTPGCASYTQSITIIVAGSLGLEDPGTGPVQLSLYPNPAQNILNIQYRLPESETQATINLYDHTGKLINSRILYGNTGSDSFSTEDLSSGIYSYVIIINQMIISSQRIIIAK